MMLLLAQQHDSIDWMCPINWDHDLNRGLVAAWLALPNQPGWKSNQWFDLTKTLYGNVGTLTNMTPETAWMSPSRPGGFGALSFDGTDDYVDVGDNLDFERTDPFSIALWIRKEANNKDILGKQVAWPGAGYRLSQEFSGGVQRVRFSMISSTLGIIDVQTSVSTLALSTWTYIILTYDGSAAASGVKIYENAVSQSLSVNNDNLTSGTLLNAASFTLGKSNASYHNGLPDDIRIYNRTLSAMDGQRLYQLSLLGYPDVLNRVTRNYGMVSAPVGNRRRRVLTACGG